MPDFTSHARSSWLALVALAACDRGGLDARGELIVNGIAEDNYVWATRDPELVRLKLVKMQRDPFIWMRGTAGVYWRDITGHSSMTFGDAASSRVLLVADPHPENIGTFRASDGTMLIDWNDFDTSGYGPFEGDVRRLAAGLIVATSDQSLSREVGVGYAAQMAALANGTAPTPLGMGVAAYLDKIIKKGTTAGDTHANLDEVAPVTTGARAFAFGDVQPVAADGVIEDRLAPDDTDFSVALGPWRATHPDAGEPLVQARLYGSGVSSYPALRDLVVFSGPTASPDDDLLIELKEERDGLIIDGQPRLQASEWSSPAARSIDAERRLQARPDADPALGTVELSPLSYRINDDRGYEHGVNADDLATLDHDELVAIAHAFGGLLARAHGMAMTENGALGWTVIAHLLTTAFPDEISALGISDAAQIIADWTSFEDVDLASLVLPIVPG